MMFALGCIQSRQCNQDTCPSGVATQNPLRYKALDVDLKSARVANYHASTIANLMELIAAVGLNDPADLQPCHINRRISGTEIRNYAELYPGIPEGCLLSKKDIPEYWRHDWLLATSENW